MGQKESENEIDASLIGGSDEAQEDENEEEEDDVDFNPFLQHSPSSEGNSGISSEGEEEEEGEDDAGFAEEELQVAGIGDHYLESGIFAEGVFVELGSDGDQEDEEIEIYEDDDEEEENEDEDEDEEEHEKEEVSVGIDKITLQMLDRKDPIPFEAADGNAGGCCFSESSGMECEIHATTIEIHKSKEDSLLDREKENTDQMEEMMGHALDALPELKSLRDERFSMETENSDNDVELDAIFKRTRAHYSLADMSLDQLEMFLQESDEEDYFQNVDDEEEYRKFLTAVKIQLEGDDQEKAQDNEEDDDEDDDDDFEVEIEEVLGSDFEDAGEKISPKLKHQATARRPETREKTREIVRIQNKERLLGLARTPLRRLLPYTGSEGSASDRIDVSGNVMLEGTSKSWQSNATKRAAVYGFTAHQIGQLYCLIHEHVQLLLQVFSLSILEPSRQQIAIDIHNMLMELTEKRDSILSWKRSAFPDFCFRPPYTHASAVEGHWDRFARVVASISTLNTLHTTVTEHTVDPELQVPFSKISSGVLLGTDGCMAGGPSTGTSSGCTDAQITHSSQNALDTAADLGSSSYQICQEWVPTTSGPVRSLLDVAPLALVRGFLSDVAIVVEDYRRRHVESGDYHRQCEREPLFPLLISEQKELKYATTTLPGYSPAYLGDRSVILPKKTMAATLVENTKKQCIALVPKEISRAMRRFFSLFNVALYPHKPPPVASANRLLFTEAEDELLAMGLMIYNTDWGAIQQRFLPSKSTHQIFVRQKNRSSSKAPENCIKAVRQMKASPLTTEEVACIQEALRCFKFDWNKVWMFSVPHRDPSLLPRQLRTALGTQKSYKLDEASKERRRANDASKRSAKILLELSKLGPKKDGVEVPLDHSIDEAGEGNSGDEDTDDPGEAYIHEAFLADWKPCTAGPLTAITSFPSAVHEDIAAHRSLAANELPSGHGSHSINICDIQHPLQSSHFSHQQGCPLPFIPSSMLTKTTLETVPQEGLLKRPLSAPFTSQCPWPQKRSCIQTVKLAPGLPSVNLPPHVRVISLSTVQGKQPALNRASNTAQMQTGVFSSLQHRVSTQENNCSSSEQPQNGTELLRGKVLRVHQEQEVDEQLHPLLLQQSVEPCLQGQSSDGSQTFLSARHDPIPRQNTSLDLVHPLLQKTSPAFHPFFGAPVVDQASGCSRPKPALRPASVRCAAPTQRASSDFHPLLQHQVPPNQLSITTQTYSGKRLSSPFTLQTGIMPHADANALEVSSSVTIARQESVYPREAELQQSAIGSSEWVRSDRGDLRTSLGFMQRQLERGSDMPETVQCCRKIIQYDFLRQSSSVNEKHLSVRAREKISSSFCRKKKRPTNKCASNSKLQKVNSAKCKESKVKPPTRKSAKEGKEVDEVTGINDSHTHIVMEQEELSDSEEEVDAEVQFEYEEMVDSDVETSESVQPIARADREDCIEFEEEEIGTDESDNENFENVAAKQTQDSSSIAQKSVTLKTGKVVGVQQALVGSPRSTTRFSVNKNDSHSHDLETGGCSKATRSGSLCSSKKKSSRKEHEVFQRNLKNGPVVDDGKLKPKGLPSKSSDDSRHVQDAGSCDFDKDGITCSLPLHQFPESPKASGGMQSQCSSQSKCTKFGRQSGNNLALHDATAIEAAHLLAVIHQRQAQNI